MQTLEENTSISLSCGSPASYQEDRAQFIDWMTWIAIEYMFQDQILLTAIWIFDVVCSTAEIAPEQIPLVGACSMWIASKFDEVENPSIQNFIAICHDQFSAEDFLDMEGKALRAIRYDVARPNATNFSELILSQIPIDDEFANCVAFYCNAASFAPEMTLCRPSHIAMAAVILGKLSINLRMSVKVAIRMLPVLDQAEIESCLSVISSTAECLLTTSASLQRKFTDLFTNTCFEAGNVASVIRTAITEGTIMDLIEDI
jgi:hypothetical protein